MFLPSAKQREAPELRKRSLTCHVNIVDLKTDFDTDGRTLRGRKEVLKARVARDGIYKKNCRVKFVYEAVSSFDQNAAMLGQKRFQWSTGRRDDETVYAMQLATADELLEMIPGKEPDDAYPHLTGTSSIDPGE